MENSMDSIQPTTGFVLRFWWAFLWRQFLIAMPIMLIVGVLTAGIFSGLGDVGANTAARIATFLVSLAISIPVTKMVIGARLGKYRLIVVKADE
jgi:hypothetical protein